MSKVDAQESIVREIQSEKAATLARAARGLERALAELEAAPPERRPEAFAEAAERLWCVVVQREAMGVLRHETLYETYRVPREVRLRMGPRRTPAGVRRR
ncbi:MAG TPA: DUF6665 family protein [Anaeromyxobacteraceae bacterium]|nr:DUF6665 family protein [Anaeromyxobacteraceae bacterium]